MSKENKKSLQLLVSGNVQGVGFRFFTHKIAESMGIVGEVKNLSDGRVEIFAEGDEAQLNSFITKVQQGPASADVSKIDSYWSEFKNQYSDFHVSG